MSTKKQHMLQGSQPLAGKRALVTGASGGLGRHFALVLAKAGADLVVAARRRAYLEALVQEIEEMGRKAFAVQLDVTDETAIKDLFSNSAHTFGVPVDILVNNAGTGAARRFLDIDEAFWDQVMDTNLKSIWRMSQAFSNELRSAGQCGRIINISSIYGLQAARGNAAYCTSKAAVLQLTKVMALDLIRYGISTSALCPGHFETDMTRDFLESEIGQDVVAKTPMQRSGLLTELSGPLLLLASDAGSYINGAVLTVDGGTSLQGL